MKIRDIKSYEEFRDNHEIWCVCKNCHHEYDLRKDWKCPFCGTYPEK